jgi:hypothetical protein
MWLVHLKAFPIVGAGNHVKSFGHYATCQKGQKAKGKRQKAKGKRQKAKGRRQEAKGRRQLFSSHFPLHNS